MDSRNPAAPDRSQVSNNGKLLTILGTSARIEGKFQIAESIEVQCDITGELSVGGTLVIGDRGRVQADVATVNAVIIGTYAGNLKATGSVEIAASGRVSGTIESNELVIAKGAVFTGSVAHIEKETRTRPAVAAQQRHAEPVSAPAPSAPAPQPAGSISDLETAIPVARLIELDAGERNAPETSAPRSSFRIT